ncbi:SusD-like starch-binding protein associating with outer membrane [Chitinophaga dinghuensis]|uniref:SusD-like starch-binding protein associating with outer membrane n=1 Tax=Chitinophaga dinghuensis TaxID=1539050 RepID=A0A327VQY2_9BACT|nr:SusD/RagB family nutrient-binding outer membrane lipoprotein [Chitinophaga dinghuensis]RAJ76787.1 SusD-like starch-binding protein associating with outer membrane [Chitinophaga dinghuensis]
MTKHISKKAVIATLIAGLGFSSCTKKFDKINTNPDKPSTAASEWLATNILTSVTSKDISQGTGFRQPFTLGKYISWTELMSEYQYNKLTRVDFARLLVLRDVDPMIKNASTADLKNTFEGFGHFIRAWQFFQTTMQVGDIPYSQAIQGSSGVIKAKYDTQKDVFLGILNELDQADQLLSKGVNFTGDFIYQGNVDKWRRLANSFQLYVLINLYKKTTDKDLDVINRFKAVAARPLMRDFNDNFAVTYTASAGYCYPWSSTPAQINSFLDYPVLSSYLLDPMKASQDKRLFYMAEPSPAQISAGKTASDYNAYLGIDPADELGTIVTNKKAGNSCAVNKRYEELFNAEPVGLLNYWDVQFILAEAAVRGWITGTDAQTYYANGIKSHMNFLVKYTPASYAHGMVMDDAYINAFPATVTLAGTAENQIKQIITQKYIAGFFQNSDFNAWYENRRTGYPAFTLKAATNMNTPANAMPVRWMYPQKELDYNSDNVNSAVNAQYGGFDDANQIMWLLK